MIREERDFLDFSFLVSIYGYKREKNMKIDYTLDENPSRSSIAHKLDLSMKVHVPPNMFGKIFLNASGASLDEAIELLRSGIKEMIDDLDRELVFPQPNIEKF